MGLKTIIFNSELEFRNYVILNSKRISSIIVFEDLLDCTIFFYCFFQEGLIVATKEHSENNFSTYRKIYQQLKAELNLRNEPYLNQQNVIKLIR